MFVICIIRLHLILLLINKNDKFNVYLRYCFAHDIFVFFFRDVLFGIMGFENQFHFLHHSLLSV